MMTEDLLHSVSTMSERELWNLMVAVTPGRAATHGRYQQLKTLTNEWGCRTVRPATPINRVVQWGLRGTPGRLAWLRHAPSQGAGPIHYLGPTHPQLRLSICSI
jgi:hypothetical protein